MDPFYLFVRSKDDGLVDFSFGMNQLQSSSSVVNFRNNEYISLHILRQMIIEHTRVFFTILPFFLNDNYNFPERMSVVPP